MNILHTETPNNPFIHDILVEDLNIHDHHGHKQTGLDPTSKFFWLGNDGGGARHRNITFRNIRLTSASLPPSGLNGNCEGVTFDGIYWNGNKISTGDTAMRLTRAGGPITNVIYL